MPYHNDTIMKTDTFINIYISHFICKGSKRLCGVLLWEGAGDRTELKYSDPKVMAVSVVSFSFSRAAQQEAQGPFCWVMAFFIASYQHLLRTSTHQGPKAPFGLMWLSLPHLVYDSNCLQLNWPQHPSWLCCIIVQHLHDHPLDLWNQIFNRHQAEMTVLQFTGHSLPVHQSMSVPWEFS